MTTSRATGPAFLAVASALLFAGAASATWLETGDVTITILTPSIQFVEASEVQPGDIMGAVSVGDTLYDTTGEVTVIAEGSVTEPKQLGNWSIYGTGNVQSVIGTGNFVVGATVENPGVLHILNSDVSGGSSYIRVSEGTLTVQASKVRDVEVFDGGSAYFELSSQLRHLQTHETAYVSIRESIASGTLFCRQRGTVLVQDSLLRCGSMNVELGADVDVGIFTGPNSVLEITNKLRVDSASLGVSSTIVTTGLLEVNGLNSVGESTALAIANTIWTNAGGLQVDIGPPTEPVEMTVSSGSHYHDLATVRVAGEPAWQHLTVTGADTEFEVDGDLRIGEYISNGVKTFSGNVTVADGATVIVHGELALRPLGVLNLEPGGTVYAASLDNDGTINENGGTLVLPEASATAAALAASFAIGVCRRRRR